MTRCDIIASLRRCLCVIYSGAIQLTCLRFMFYYKIREYLPEGETDAMLSLSISSSTKSMMLAFARVESSRCFSVTAPSGLDVSFMLL